MFGSAMLASGCFSQLWLRQPVQHSAGPRSGSPKLARILRPGRCPLLDGDPLPPVYFLMIGSNEYVASAGASSISVQMILPDW
jgi:hypothetical protein